MVRNALPSSTLSAVSSFMRQKKPTKEPPSATPSRADQAKQAAFPECKNLFKHWWKTIDFLTHVDQAGIVLNPDKFQFAQGSVDFVGFS